MKIPVELAKQLYEDMPDPDFRDHGECQQKTIERWQDKGWVETDIDEANRWMDELAVERYGSYTDGAFADMVKSIKKKYASGIELAKHQAYNEGRKFKK